MKLKHLLSFYLMVSITGVLNAQNYPEGVYRSLVITETCLATSASGFVEITNMGDKAVRLSEFKLAYSRGGDSGNFQIFDVWNDVWGSTYYDYMFLPDRMLAPGESFVITGAYDVGPRIYKETLGRGVGGSERPKQPEFYEVADKLIHYYEPVLGVAIPGDSVTTLYNDPEQTVQQGFNPYLRALFNPQTTCSYVYLEHHYTEGDSAVIDQAGGVFDNNGRNRQSFAYDVAGVYQATGRSVLVRKYGVNQGNLDFANARGIGLGDSEWMPAVRPLPGDRLNYSGWQWRDMWWTVGNHGDYVLDRNTLESEVIEVDYDNKRLTVPWGTLRLDEIMRHMKRKPGISWEHHLNANRSDSLYRSAQTGDRLTVYVYGRELQSATFDIVVKEPTTDDNIVIPIDHSIVRAPGMTGPITTRTQNGILSWPRVTRHASGVDTITGSGYGLPYALRSDTLLKYLEKPSGARWEFVWANGIARPDLMEGDKLKVISESGKVKEYYIQMQAYSPETNANLSSITWPDIPEFYKGLFGWKGDTIPNFTSSNYQYVVEVPFDVHVIPALVAQPASINASVVVTRAKNLTGTREDRTVTLEVIAELDTIRNVYTVEYVKEKHPNDIEPYFADPIISEVLIDCPNGNHYVELANPGNQPLDLRNYIITYRRSTIIADGLSYGSWAYRYTSYIPGLKYVDEATWAVTPKIMVPDIHVNPIIPGSGTFVMATITRNYVSSTTIPYIYDKHYDVQFANGEAPDIFNPWNEKVSHNSGSGRPCVGPGNMGGYLALWKVLNDSVKLGKKRVGDPNDFSLIDICGMPDGVPWVVAGRKMDKNEKITRKPEIYQGNPNLQASFGTNPDDSEWIWTNRSYWQSLGFSSTESYFMAAQDLGQHYMVPPTHYKSTVTSSVYKVSEGYGPDEEIFGITTGTTVSAFLTNINKEHAGQILKILSSGNGSEKPVDELLDYNDILVVLSADNVNTTRYRLDVTSEGLSSNAYLTSERWNITVEVTPKSSAEGLMDAGTGSIAGFEYGTTIRTIVDNVTVPMGATLAVINGNGAYVPFKILNFDTAYVDVTVNPDIYFDVLAEDGKTRMVYQLKPNTSAGDAFILSDVYLVSQLENLINYVPRGISVPSFLTNLIPSLGASLTVVDKMGFERINGTIREDDKIVVTSANGNTTRVYHIAFRATESIPYVTYLAYVLSEAYMVDQVNYMISAGIMPLTAFTLVEDFHSYILPAPGATVAVVDSKGNEKNSGDLNGGDQLRVTSADGMIVVFYQLNLDLTSAEDRLKAKIGIYPNPTNGKIMVTGVKSGYQIRIFNATGSFVQAIIVDKTPEVVSIESMPAGIYFIEVSDGNRLLNRFKAYKL